MAGLADIVASAVQAVANETASLRQTVEVRSRTEADGLGARDYADPELVSCLVQEGEQQLETLDGRKVTVRALLTFFPDSDGELPTIAARDQVTLPSGRAGRVTEIVDGLIDPTTGKPPMRVIWLE